MAELQQDTEKYVELRNINKTYGTFKASNNINLGDRKSTRLNSSHYQQSRMPSSA